MKLSNRFLLLSSLATLGIAAGSFAVGQSTENNRNRTAQEPSQFPNMGTFNPNTTINNPFNQQQGPVHLPLPAGQNVYWQAGPTPIATVVPIYPGSSVQNPAENQRDRELEGMVQRAIAEYRQNQNEDQRSKISNDLREHVSEQFEIRQKSREQELARMEKELARLRDIQTTRNEQKDRIVSDRVEQLLREVDGLGWGSGPTNGQFPHPQSGFGSPTAISQPAGLRSQPNPNSDPRGFPTNPSATYPGAEKPSQSRDTDQHPDYGSGKRRVPPAKSDDRRFEF